MAAINQRNTAAWEPADESIRDRGDKELGAARVAMIGAWLANSRYLRKFLAEYYFKLSPYLQQEERYTKDGTSLLASSRKLLTTKVQRELGQVLGYMDAEFRSRVRRMVIRAATSQIRYLRAKGVVTPEKATIERLIENTVLGLERDFPAGTGVTYMNRLERINAEHQRHLTNILNRTYRQDAKEKIVADSRSSLMYTRPGRTPVVGGSASKKAMGLFTAEQARLVNEVEVGILKESGIHLAYWRLSPTHPWYGGKEICEVLASVQDPDISRQLHLLPGGGAGVTLEGLHQVSDWPSYPHPYCRCFPEPVIL